MSRLSEKFQLNAIFSSSFEISESRLSTLLRLTTRRVACEINIILKDEDRFGAAAVCMCVCVPFSRVVLLADGLYKDQRE